MDKKELLRSLYKVDEVLQDECLIFFKENLPLPLITESIREEIDYLRQKILKEETIPYALNNRKQFLSQVILHIEEKCTPSLRPVINATGTILHTNLGRAPLYQPAEKRIKDVSCAYSTLEYDLKTGKRGSRHKHVEELICKITGAEAAMVVNNNAAATMLVLSAMTYSKEVIVSRGELVEIGGSFRIPDIMSLSGAILKEIGTTNKTHLSDYTKAITPEQTGAIMKIHTSNYKIIGFSEDVTLEELVKLGHASNLPVIYDMGNGLLVNLSSYSIYEPTVFDAMKAGADVVLFSGDKLLGGPQAGIILGKKEYIDKMKAHPLARVVRTDKMTLASLETVFFQYLDQKQALKSLPVLKMITTSKEELKLRALDLINQLDPNWTVTANLTTCEDFIGGGCAPDIRLSGYAITLTSPMKNTEQIEALLRRHELPIITHVAQDKVWLHLRTLQKDDIKAILTAFSQIFSPTKG